MSAVPHVVVIGTGLTALTIARQLLTSLPPLAVRLTLIDKAKQPGGRLSSRTYDSGVVLETGLRVFESPKGNGKESAFEREVERWNTAGYVKEVEEDRRAGPMGNGRWWEGAGGITKLVDGLLSEVEGAASGRLSIHYNVQTTNPTPITHLYPLQLTTLTPISLDPISLLVHTAPSPQVAVLLPPTLPTAVAATNYIKTFALLLPTLIVPKSYTTVYHRHPHALLTSISTGLSSPLADGTRSPAGFVLQSTPEKLGLGYTKEEASDEIVRSRFFEVLKQSGLLPVELVEEAEKLVGRESQVKRWKFAQVEKAGEIEVAEEAEQADEIVVMAGGRLLLAGDGTSGGVGGLYGAWRAGVRASEEIKGWLESRSKDSEARL